MAPLHVPKLASRDPSGQGRTHLPVNVYISAAHRDVSAKAPSPESLAERKEAGLGRIFLGPGLDAIPLLPYAKRTLAGHPPQKTSRRGFEVVQRQSRTDLRFLAFRRQNPQAGPSSSRGSRKRRQTFGRSSVAQFGGSPKTWRFDRIRNAGVDNCFTFRPTVGESRKRKGSIGHQRKRRLSGLSETSKAPTLFLGSSAVAYALNNSCFRRQKTKPQIFGIGEIPLRQPSIVVKDQIGVPAPVFAKSQFAPTQWSSGSRTNIALSPQGRTYQAFRDFRRHAQGDRRGPIGPVLVQPLLGRRFRQVVRQQRAQIGERQGETGQQACDVDALKCLGEVAISNAMLSVRPKPRRQNRLRPRFQPAAP